MAKPQHQVVYTAEPRCEREVTPEIVHVPEASRWPWTTVEVIGVSEVLMLDDVVRWTHVV
jgi:hypothetical protein